MVELVVRNVQEAYVRGLARLRQHGRWEDSRNGRALVLPEAMMTTYERPLERVLLDPGRDANPFFHLLESLWMLAGSRDVASLEPFNSGLKTYSDDGVTYHGAYGYRWRRHFISFDPIAEEPRQIDQLATAIELLRANPADRRVVISMWDPEADLGQEGRDFPCNTHLYFRVRDVAYRDPPVTDQNSAMHEERIARGDNLILDMAVLCRSNDAIWGAYGANAVHFSVLLEFVAAACGFRVGRLTQLSWNFHAYEATLEKVGEALWPVTDTDQSGRYSYVRSVPLGRRVTEVSDHYTARDVQPTPLFVDCSLMPVADLMGGLDEIWDYVGRLWAAEAAEGVVRPMTDVLSAAGLRTIECMVSAYWHFRQKDRGAARDFAGSIPRADDRNADSDWRRACTEWLERRYAK